MATKNKVIARIKGGLGNQLFCYAAARRLALANNAELVIDDVTGFARDRQYRRKYMLGHFNIAARKAAPAERLEPFERCRRGAAKFLSKAKPFFQRSYLEEESAVFDPRLLDFKVQGALYLDGLWQCEKYFKDAERTIREELRISPPRDPANAAMAEKIRGCNAVSLHVRWFDDAAKKDSAINLPPAYYTRAVKEITRKVQDPHFFIFSDDPAAARQVPGLPGDRSTVVSHNQGEESAYTDLWLMTQCKHFIAANSTFSWWGAWLADMNAAKQVIVPDAIRKFNADIIPPGWESLPQGGT